ncbi:16S rRNA (cytidine(1402)-2'-O)-methyltransferase [Acuticoccus sediminis]|uniref:16S rRNA (cytidine(1402)-2'-O)-methyltransferase n=1 Tax=Acuticoccus sediminis TaxID=2184697 RepID=UPI001CFE9874|nr:16S rRNA (cytidine(1402)-2'-O)-methyltransferase [Acuticoccus sediminis]
MARRTFVVDGVSLNADPAPPGLHIVATPIGNLGDITLRALKTLAGADMVAAEDTRHTGRLLQHFGIEAHLVRYDEHGAAAQRPRLLADLAEGRSVALVSDAGTPLISDPGYRLVREARDAGIAVHAVPGPAAPMAAASVAGLPTDSLLFVGFLPPRHAARVERIRELMAVPATLVFFEAPHRLAETLADLAGTLGPREAAVARELTKRFETVDRAPLGELAERYAGTETKGEIVLLVGPPAERGEIDEAEVDALLAAALDKLPASAAAADVARATGLKRRDLYKRALAMKS